MKQLFFAILLCTITLSQASQPPEPKAGDRQEEAATKELDPQDDDYALDEMPNNADPKT